MRLEVVDLHVGQTGRERQRLRRAHADQQRAGETRSVTGGDGVELAGLQDARFHERLVDDGIDELDVGAAGELGHDPAVGSVELDLAGHDGRAHLPAVLHHRGGRLVARRLDPEDSHYQRFGSSTTVSPSIWRSIPSSSSEYSARWASCRSEEHTSELQSQSNLVCRLLLEKKKYNY